MAIAPTGQKQIAGEREAHHARLVALKLCQQLAGAQVPLLHQVASPATS